MADLSNSGSGNSSTSGNNKLEQSPFGRLKEVVPEKDFVNLFSGVGDGKGGGSPFGGGGAGGGSQPDLAYGGNPFAGDNFWNIFAGGVNPSKVGGNPTVGGANSTAGGSNPTAGGANPFASGGNPTAGGANQGSGSDPLTGAGSQTDGISTTKIPDGFGLRVTIDNLVNSRLNKEPGGGQIPSFGSGQIPSFGNGQIPSSGSGQIPSFSGEEMPSFGSGKMSSIGGGQTPSFGGQNPFA